MSGVLQILSFDVKERLAKGEKLQIIDVREPGEVAFGMIPGAKHIALGELPARLQEIDKERETIFVCRSGARSANACEFAKAQGYTKVKNFMGGMNAWDGELT